MSERRPFRIRRLEQALEFCWLGPQGPTSRSLIADPPALASAQSGFCASIRSGPWAPPDNAADYFMEISRLTGALLSQAFKGQAQPGDWIELQDGTFIPWEVASLETAPFWRAFTVSRLFPEKPWQRPAQFRGLLVTDPLEAMRWAPEEGPRLGRSLAGLMECEQLTGPQATGAALVRAINHSQPTLLYLSAYADLEGTDTVVHLADGSQTLESLASRVAVAPALVILHLPLLRAPAGRPGLLEPLAAWAREWFAKGSRCVLAAAWESPQSPALMAVLAKRLAAGDSVATALKAAREEVLAGADPYRTAHAWFLFGDASLSLPRTTQPETVLSSMKPRFQLVVTAGPEEGRKIPVYLMQARKITLGSRGMRGNDIDLEDPELENQAISLEISDKGLELMNLTSEPGRVQVNGLPVAEATLLLGGEEVRLGSSTLRIDRTEGDAPAARPRETRESRFVLEVVGAPGTRHLLSKGVTVVGRLPSCQLQLDDPAVSRQHVSVTWRDGLFVLAHLGTNPTLLNGIPVEEERELRHGDLIALSETSVLRFGDSAKEA